MSSIWLALFHLRSLLVLAAVLSPVLAGVALRLLPGAAGRALGATIRPEGG